MKSEQPPLHAVSTASEVDSVPFQALAHGLNSMPRSALRHAVSQAYRADEHATVMALLSQQPVQSGDAPALAARLVQAVRHQRTRAGGVDALMHEFSLSSEEGVALMCLAEALLRIPDAATRKRLIADKIGGANWKRHLGESPSMFINAAAWGLLISGKLVRSQNAEGLSGALRRLLARGGQPLVQRGVDLAMRVLGDHFVSGQSIEQALHNSADQATRGYRYSFDMLGEAALTLHDAAHYFNAYATAIEALGASGRASTRAGEGQVPVRGHGSGLRNGPGISVKLSALHPRYSISQRECVMQELLPRLQQLAYLARQHDIGLNIDAEEADRLELSMDLLEALAFDPALEGFDGIGFVVQAYQKRCPQVLDWLIDLAQRSGRRFMVRLVKGAYWDTEIKRAQVDGMTGYPVFTRKAHTDVCYLVCAHRLLQHTDLLYPQFATHNAHTLATIHCWALSCGVSDFEFQCLYGMGETLYDQVLGADKLNRVCRIYAPVGSHHSLLPYLVRRLLENGANASFVNQLVDDKLAPETLLADPFAVARQSGATPHPAIPLPLDLFGTAPGCRRNSIGLDLSDTSVLRELAASLAALGSVQWHATVLLAEDEGEVQAGAPSAPTPSTRHIRQVRDLRNPARHNDIVGSSEQARMEDVERALRGAARHASAWAMMPTAARATVLQHAADLLQQHHAELISLIVREAGRSISAAAGEVREAVDFLRYYAQQLHALPPAAPLGTVVCITPWNFPLAIFIGEVSAALACGNAVIAKPAEQTPITAWRAVQLLHAAGVPRGALQLLPGEGETIGAALVAASTTDGVVFTGSTEVAAVIQRVLAERGIKEKRLLPLIAETGGQNAMIVDASALPEQVVQDVLTSAFDSAGQRCSSLRVLCLQEEIAEHVLRMLRGAMDQLHVGMPDRIDTDVGPVIDAHARSILQDHVAAMRARGKKVVELPLPLQGTSAHGGSFMAPCLIEIASIAELKREVFGPVLHVLRYRSDGLRDLIAEINATGYGLTLGIHSRIDATIGEIVAQARVGNIYVNRNMIGAVVGVQPFGGMGKSGTGPKAGGPWYLRRLMQPLKEDRAPTVRAVATEELIRDLPGPTGETNRWSVLPRGAVLCLLGSWPMLERVIGLLVDMGNRPLLLRADARRFERQARESGSGLLAACVITEDMVGTSAEDDTAGAAQANEPGRNRASLSISQIAAVIYDPVRAPEVMALQCNQQLPLLLPVLNDTLPDWRSLLAEQTITVNTTAAGGNATLMTL